MTDAPLAIWLEVGSLGHDLALKLLAADGQAYDVLEQVAELEVENEHLRGLKENVLKSHIADREKQIQRLRGVIAEMVMYDWSGDRGAPNTPPDNLRKNVAEAIGCPDTRHPER